MRSAIAWFKRHWVWLKWPVALALLAFLFYQNRNELRGLSERHIVWPYFGIAFVLAFASLLLTFVRWYLLVWSQGFPFRLRDAMRLGFLGYLFNYVGPGAVGGDVIKAVWLAKEQQSRRMAAAATVVLDRILGLLALFLVGSAASLLPSEILQRREIEVVGSIALLWGGAVGGLLGLLVMLHPATPQSRWLNRLVHLRFVGGIIAEMLNSIVLYQTKRRVVLAAVVLSIFGHFGILSAFYFCALALHSGEPIPDYASHLFFIPAAEVVGVIVPTPAGMGALEWAVQRFYVLANLAAGLPTRPETAAANGLLTAIGYRAITIVIAAIGGVYYFTSRREIAEVLHETEQQTQVGAEHP